MVNIIRRKNWIIIFIAFIVIVLLGFLAFNYFGLTGKVIFEGRTTYNAGELINGRMNVLLKAGEFIPAGTEVKIKLNGQEKTMLLSELVGSSPTSGNYYAEGISLSGSGNGYGNKGKIAGYPAVGFELMVFGKTARVGVPDNAGSESGSSNGFDSDMGSNEQESEESRIDVPDMGNNSEEGAESEGSINEGGELIGDVIRRDVEEPVEESNNGAGLGENKEESAGDNGGEPVEQVPGEVIKSEEQENSENVGIVRSITGAITGFIIGGEAETPYIITGEVVKEGVFAHELKEGQGAKIVDESVSVNGKKADNNAVSLNVINNKAEVRTNYEVVSEGYGKEFLGKGENMGFGVDFNEFGVKAEDGVLEVELVYNGVRIAGFSERININEASGKEIEGVNEKKAEGYEVSNAPEAGAGFTGTVIWEREYEVSSKSGNESLLDVTFEPTIVNYANYTNNETGNTTLLFREWWTICVGSNSSEINYTQEIDVSGLGLLEERETIKKNETFTYYLPDEMSIIVQDDKSNARHFVKRREVIREIGGIRNVVNKGIFEEGDVYAYCYLADPWQDYWMKFGESSVVLTQSYTITTDLYNQNITNEDVLYTHLNVSDANLLGYWSFDKDNATNVYDLSDKGNDGTLVGNANVSGTGVYGNGLGLDGDEDYVSLGTWSITGTAISVSAWFKTYSGSVDAGSLDIIVGKYSPTAPALEDWALYLNEGSGTIGFFVYSTSLNIISGTTNLSDNTWHHAVGVWNGTANLLYVDGVSVATPVANTGTLDALLTDIRIGRGAENTWKQLFKGSIDEVRIYNKSLTQSEITALYQNQSSTFYPKGQQEYKVFNAILTNENRLNVTTNGYERKQGTNISLSVGEWNVNNGYDNTDSSLVLSLHLDNRSSLGENSTYVVDSSKYGNNGTLVGNAIVNSSGGRYGWGLNLDGNGDYVNFGDVSSLSFTDGAGNDLPFTISTWVNLAEFTNSHNIVTKYNDAVAYEWDISYFGSEIWFLLRSSDNSKYLYRTSAFTSANYLNKWVHVVGTYNGSEVKEGIHLYINGVLTDTSTGSVGTYVGMSNTNAPALVGTRFASGVSQNAWNGNIDEVRIYNRSLSAQEIKQLYVTGLLTYNWTAEQNLSNVDSNDNSSINQFTISSSSTDFIARYRMWSNANNSYTSYLGNNNVSYNFFLLNLVYTIAGRVVDDAGAGISGAVVYVLRQSDNTLAGNLTTNSTGGFSTTVTQIGNYTITGFDPANVGRSGDIMSHVVVGLWRGLVREISNLWHTTVRGSNYVINQNVEIGLGIWLVLIGMGFGQVYLGEKVIIGNRIIRGFDVGWLA